MTHVLNRTVTDDETKIYITRDKGPYRLAAVFVDELQHRSWPPFLPDEDELRSFGCYREGEGPEKYKIESFLQ